MAKLKVRARTVDMLGRQQIAGIATAIHELLKNAHDAYAENTRIDFFQDQSLLLLRDDGFGMTRDDFENRWLTLGTESKLDANTDTSQVWTGPNNLPRRAILGEKGIGRFAIAAVGPQVLIFSKAVRRNGAHKTVTSFVNWSIFEQPGINLADIDIPILETENSVPTDSQIEKLRSSFLSNFDTLKSTIAPSEIKRIAKEVNDFKVNLTELLQNTPGPIPNSEAGGTCYVIQPASNELEIDLVMSEQLGTISAIQRYLLGFGNTMRKGAPGAPVSVEFWSHSQNESKELIGPLSFFTPDEFEAADHHIEGVFDDNGVFRGKVKIYESVEHEYTLSPPPELSSNLQCGQFRLNIAYVQGALADSRMEETMWRKVTAKMDAIGGMYVYRDGVRILPYGNSNYDWLNIERRRTLSAQDWFFSYRRMVGGVEISAKHNGNLKEKAGREGFRENSAYRQLKSLIENLLRQLAIDFFRADKAKISTDFYRLRTDRQEEAKVLKRRAESLKKRRTDFKKTLENVAAQLDNMELPKIAGEILTKFRQEIAQTRKIKNPNQAGKYILQMEADTQAQILVLKEKLNIVRPRGFKPAKTDQKTYVRLESMKNEFISQSIEPIEELISEGIEGLLDDGVVEFKASERIITPIYDQASQSMTTANKLRTSIGVAMVKLSDQTRVSANKLISELNQHIEEVKVNTNKSIDNITDEKELIQIRDIALQRIGNHSSEITGRLSDLLAQIENLNLTGSVEDSQLAVVEALEGQNMELQEKLEKFAELAQVGMALGVVQHEFSGHSRNLSNALKNLKPWAESNTKLSKIFNEMVASGERLTQESGFVFAFAANSASRRDANRDHL